MWSRCTNPLHRRYWQYADRLPPDEWRDFQVFLEHVGPRPSSRHSLDRIRNAEPYGPGNVRWATPKEQTRNRSTNRLVIHRGVVVSLAEACELEGLDRKTIANRMRTRSAFEASNGAFREK
jgi:hypothetical protein